MKKSKYKPGDIVLAKSPAGDAIPAVQVRLIKRTYVPERKDPPFHRGPSIATPEFAWWTATLVRKEDADMLRKEWSIPFKHPDKMNTSVYERNIVKVIKKNRRKQKRE